MYLEIAVGNRHSHLQSQEGHSHVSILQTAQVAENTHYGSRTTYIIIMESVDSVCRDIAATQ